MDAANEGGAGKCPVPHGSAGRSNRDWWPNQLDLSVLHQHTALSNPMGSAFDYAEAFKKLDLKALKADLTALMTNSGLRQEVSVTASIMLMSPPCPLCKVNNASGSQEAGQQDYYEIHHVLSADAERRRGTSPTTPALGSRTVGTFFSLQPWPINPDCQKLVGTAEASKVKL